MEVYVDDMILKRKKEVDHFDHLEKTFDILRKYGLKLNPNKYTFGVRGGIFLGYMVSQREIEANPKKSKQYKIFDPQLCLRKCRDCRVNYCLEHVYRQNGR